MPFLDDLPSKAEIVSYWKDKLWDLGFHIDWGEASCWACRFHYGSKYDIESPGVGWDIVLKCWTAMPLQRCPIVPRSLDGSNGVENLFLMCRECHDLAPKTDIPKIFFEWARVQRSWKRDNQKLDSAFEAFGVGDSEKHELLAVLESQDFRTWIDGRVGIHRPQSNYASTTARLTPATMIGLACHYRSVVRTVQRSREFPF